MIDPSSLTDCCHPTLPSFIFIYCKPSGLQDSRKTELQSTHLVYPLYPIRVDLSDQRLKFKKQLLAYFGKVKKYQSSILTTMGSNRAVQAIRAKIVPPPKKPKKKPPE